jgi:hypothetical protein
MPTSDDFPGPNIAEEVQFEDRTSDGNPSVNGAVRLVSDDLVVKLSSGIKSLTTGTGLSEGQHRSLRQLVHFMHQRGPGPGFGAGPYVSEVLPAGDPFPVSETWYETASKLKRIVRHQWTYNANKTLATETWIVYKTDGTSPAAQAVDSPIVYTNGVFETGRTRTVTVYP